MPLSGVRVLDLTRLLPGPYATRLLAELGASVIKVEDPTGGDYARWYPPLAGDPPTGGIFREVNAGKKSVTLDLKRPEALIALRALARASDVLVDSFRPGVLARLGLDPRALMEESPRLIYCAITGFGLTGPDADRAGHDIGYLARAGALGISGPKERPVVAGIQVADVGSSFAAVCGILAAMVERERTGRGKVVDISLTETSMAFAATAFGMHHAEHEVRRGEEMLDGSKPCYGVYETKDGRFLAVGSLEPKFWMKLLSVLGLEDLAGSPLDGGESGAAARARVQARLAERTLAEWTAIFRSAEACVEPVLTMEEAERDAHFVARHTKQDGIVRGPVRVTDWPNVGGGGRALCPAPALGADTKEVLRSLELPADVLAALLD
jgi:crotonobetainyl-CoA:carnitine CoA-transferase CaiB-like acyl-CoA transferase